MIYFKQFAILALFLFLGVMTNHLLNAPIPGSVIGMIYLLCALNLKLVRLEEIETVANFFLANILLFFVPLGVSLMTAFGLIQDTWWKLLIVVITSTGIVMSITALTVQFLEGKKTHE